MPWQGNCPKCEEPFYTSEIWDSRTSNEKTFHLGLEAEGKCPKCGETMKVFMIYSKC